MNEVRYLAVPSQHWWIPAYRGDYAMKELPRDDDGKLSAYAWPGRYPIYYLDREDCIICAVCARRDDQDRECPPERKPVSADVNYGEFHLYCDDCSEKIEAAYE
jgi:hypothetical protein